MSRPRPTAQQRLRSHFRAGAAAILATVAVVYLVFGGPLPFQGGYDVHALLPSANELRNGSPVRIAGVNVGKVTGIGRGPGTTARVTMRIEEHGLPLHRDATLKVRPRLFLEGNFFVDLRPGTPGAPELRDGATLPPAQAAIPVQLDQVLSALGQSTREDLTTLLDQYGTALSRGGAKGVNDAFAASRGAFTGTALLAQEARGLDEHDLSELVAHGEQVVGALDSRREQLAGLVTAFNRTMQALSADTGALSASVAGLDATVQEAGPALRDLDAALPPLRSFAADVRPLLRRAPRTLDLANPLVDELGRLVAPGVLPPLVRSARPVLRDLAPLVSELRTLLARVDPVTRCVRDNALPALTSVLEDGDHGSGQPVWQELLHGMVGLASASQNFDANGPAVRYLAGFGEQLISSGQLPGGTQLLGVAPEPIQGSRPRQPATKPPFRPDVPCVTQKRPAMQAATTPPPPARRAAPRTPTARERVLLARDLRRARAAR